MALQKPEEVLFTTPERPKPIHFDWDEGKLGIPCFNTGSLNLIGPHLSRPTPGAGANGGESVSDVRLAMLLGVAPWDLEILDLRTNKTVPGRIVEVESAEARAAPLATGASLGQDVGPARDYHDEAQKVGAGAALPTKRTISSYRAFDRLQRGTIPGYAFLLSPAGEAEMDPQKGGRRTIPYRWLARDGHVTRAEVDRMSRTFYTKVWKTLDPPSFRAAFAEAAATPEEAAKNQASWFYRYFGGLEFGGRGPYDYHNAEQQAAAAGEGGAYSSGVPGGGSAGEDLARIGLREGLLTRSLVPKHPDLIMTLEHALVWIGTMAEAIEESSPGENQAVVRYSVLMFALHFLGFFPFTEAELCKIYEKTISLPLTASPIPPAAGAAASKL